MSIKIKFDHSHNAIEPTLVLATKNGRKIGKLPAYNIVFKDCLNTCSEFSFRVNKSDCIGNSEFWKQIVDLKLLWVREWNRWFEIYVEIDESSDTIKNISAKSLGEAELSQSNLHGIEINTETDISREDYEPTVLYRATRPKASLLTRISEKIPNYKYNHIDSSIAGIQRTFEFNNISVYDAFQEIAEEINCIFIINCYSDSNGKIVREINVYDLEANCLDCGERGEFITSCPKCGSKNILQGYGEDTTIFISTDNLADNISYVTDNGSVKNCFKLEAGDDLMTATIVNSNPNGSSYLWYISDAVKEDMSSKLVQKLDKYDEDYTYYQNIYKANVSGSELTAYNNLVEKYRQYSEDYCKITSPIVGYPALMEAYYNTIDFYLYLSSGLMPPVETSDVNAKTEVAKLSNRNLSPISVKDLNICSNATADSAVLAMAKVLVNKRYQVKISESTFASNNWTGKFIVTNYSDEEDTAVSSNVTIRIDDDFQTYVEQKISKALRQSLDDGEITDVIGLFSSSDTVFVNELKKYSLTRLTSFYDSCKSCIDVLAEQGIGNNLTWANSAPNLYASMYLPYYNKLGYIEAEMKVREDEIAIITGKYGKDGDLISSGIQTIIEKERDKIQTALDFEKYLGEELWLEFVAYRREDTFSNSNYVSDGLNNAELFENARRFIEIAEKEIYKSATLQHSITATLKNLLVMKEFAPIVDYFEVGNWLRIRVDDKIYRLRLLDYEIDFDNLDNISITFSDVTIVKDGTSDINDVLNQAASMSTSYESTKRQAKEGSNSKNRLDDWVKKGLDATNVKIISNADNQSQTWDSHGMLFRYYDPITDSYDDCQLKIINSTLAVTDDNWKTIKTAVGAFYYYDPVTGKLTEAYGVNAEVLIGKLILGEELGIYNSSNSLSFDRNGLVITNGINSFIVNPNDRDLLVLSNEKEDILWVDDKGGLHIRGDGKGLDITANDTINNMSSRITQNADAISLEVERATQSETVINGYIETVNQSLSSSIEQTASSITLKVEEETQRAIKVENELGTTIENNYNSLSATIDIEIRKISLVVAEEEKRAKSVESELGTNIEEEYKRLQGEIQISANNILESVSSIYETKTDAGTTKEYLEGQISISADNILQSVSGIYETKTDAEYEYKELHSSIDQTAESIKLSVAKAVSKYDTSGYSIALYGYVAASSSGYSASDYSGQYYLNQTNGYLYKSNGSSWSYVATLTLITSSLQSQINQLPHKISLSVSNGSLGNTASIVLDVDGSTISKNLNLSNVRKAFADDTSKISISAGTITFSSNTLIVDSDKFKVSSDGTINATGATISSQSGQYFAEIGSGYFHGGRTVNAGAVEYFETNGFLSFNTKYTTTGKYGANLAGEGLIVLSSPYLGVANYSTGGTATVTIGQSGTITVATPDGKTKTIRFEKGLMVTDLSG